MEISAFPICTKLSILSLPFCGIIPLSSNKGGDTI
nr:MAG TPA: hypothetical protein [Bacteriophage sp.]